LDHGVTDFHRLAHLGEDLRHDAGYGRREVGRTRHLAGRGRARRDLAEAFHVAVQRAEFDAGGVDGDFVFGVIRVLFLRRRRVGLLAQALERRLEPLRCVRGDGGVVEVDDPAEDQQQGDGDEDDAGSPAFHGTRS